MEPGQVGRLRLPFAGRPHAPPVLHCCSFSSTQRSPPDYSTPYGKDND